MFDDEFINDMLTCFTTITNALISLGKPIDNDQKVRKIIRVLSQAWEVKSTTLKELNDKEKIDFTAFMGNSKTYKMEMKARKDRESQKDNGVALKASPRDYKKKCVATLITSKDEELTFLVKNINMYLKNRKRSGSRRKSKKEVMKATS